MMLVVVSMSGSWLPRTASASGNGWAVPSRRDAPAVAIAAWVIAIIGSGLSVLDSSKLPRDSG